MKHTNVLTNYALIHNGMLPIKPKGDISDTMEELREDLQVILAKAICKNISKEEVHQLVDEIYSNYADE